MATRKRKRRRKSTSLSMNPAKRRKRRRRSLSESGRVRRYARRAGSYVRGTTARTFTRTGLIEEAKRFVAGTAGGLAAGAAHQLMNPLPTWGRVVIQGTISFLICGVGGAKNLGAGYAGGASALEAQEFTQRSLSQMGLSSNRYADTNSANQLPLTLSDNRGNPLTLMEDTSTNTMYYLDEKSGVAYLAESIYPNYSPRYNQQR
jgi:hypothetical protein